MGRRRASPQYESWCDGSSCHCRGHCSHKTHKRTCSCLWTRTCLWWLTTPTGEKQFTGVSLLLGHNFLILMVRITSLNHIIFLCFCLVHKDTLCSRVTNDPPSLFISQLCRHTILEVKFINSIMFHHSHVFTDWEITKSFSEFQSSTDVWKEDVSLGCCSVLPDMDRDDRRRVFPQCELWDDAWGRRCLWQDVHILGTWGWSCSHAALPLPTERNCTSKWIPSQEQQR